MILKCKMRRGQPKSVLVARLRMAPMQDAFKILSFGLAENGLISVSQELENQTVSFVLAS
jgi:hypothetical protein